ANLETRVETVAVTVDTEHRRAASGRTQQVEQQPDRRRFAGAVRAEEAEYFPARDVEREILDANDWSVVLRQAFDTNGRVGHHRVRRAFASSRNDARNASAAGTGEPSPA